jgi:hypothetical protein
MSVYGAAALFSRGLDRESVLAQINVSGEDRLGQLVTEGLAAYFARATD